MFWKILLKKSLLFVMIYCLIMLYKVFIKMWQWVLLISVFFYLFNIFLNHFFFFFQTIVTLNVGFGHWPHQAQAVIKIFSIQVYYRVSKQYSPYDKFTPLYKSLPMNWYKKVSYKSRNNLKIPYCWDPLSSVTIKNFVELQTIISNSIYRTAIHLRFTSWTVGFVKLFKNFIQKMNTSLTQLYLLFSITS